MHENHVIFPEVKGTEPVQNGLLPGIPAGDKPHGKRERRTDLPDQILLRVRMTDHRHLIRQPGKGLNAPADDGFTAEREKGFVDRSVHPRTGSAGQHHGADLHDSPRTA